MPFKLLPILGTISNLATAAWDTYNKSKQAQHNLAAEREQKTAHSALVSRVELLEQSSLEQARLLGELSKEVEQFAREMQEQLAEQQARAEKNQRFAIAALCLSAVAVIVALIILLRSHG